tara:strand:+ start:305 stop:505 length:201 start_codon:yes stop_codon:yes gene_type:complete
MIELFLWKWGLYILIIWSFIANACSATPQNLGYWIDDKPLRGTIGANKDYVRPYWECVNDTLDCNE